LSAGGLMTRRELRDRVGRHIERWNLALDECQVKLAPRGSTEVLPQLPMHHIGEAKNEISDQVAVIRPYRLT
jgi:hypothetical protein